MGTVVFVIDRYYVILWLNATLRPVFVAMLPMRNFLKLLRKKFRSLYRIHRCFLVSSCVDAVPDTGHSCAHNYLPLKAVEAKLRFVVQTRVEIA